MKTETLADCLLEGHLYSFTTTSLHRATSEVNSCMAAHLTTTIITAAINDKFKIRSSQWWPNLVWCYLKQLLNHAFLTICTAPHGLCDRIRGGLQDFYYFEYKGWIRAPGRCERRILLKCIHSKQLLSISNLHYFSLKQKCIWRWWQAKHGVRI